MTNEEKDQIIQMRKSGVSCTKIGRALGLSENTVKTFCRRNGLTGAPSKSKDQKKCLWCGKVLVQKQGRKEKKFCSDGCRNRWWNSHQELVKKKAVYEFDCACCGKHFTAYGNAGRKYCCHSCYIEDRFGRRS